MDLPKTVYIRANEPVTGGRVDGDRAREQFTTTTDEETLAPWAGEEEVGVYELVAVHKIKRAIDVKVSQTFERSAHEKDKPQAPPKTY